MDKARITEINFLERHNKTNDVAIAIDIHGVVEKPIKSIKINYIIKKSVNFYKKYLDK